MNKKPSLFALRERYLQLNGYWQQLEAALKKLTRPENGGAPPPAEPGAEPSKLWLARLKQNLRRPE